MGIKKASQFSGKIVPIIFLTFAIVSSIGIYSYNMYLETENSRLSMNIEETKTKIIKIQKDPNLQVYKLITDNQKTIDMLESQSQVATFIQRLELIGNKYNLVFGGFNYSAGIITSGVLATASQNTSSYSTVANFIKKYRTDKNTYFTLPFITQVSGSSRIKFNVKFKVKNQLPTRETIIEKIKKESAIKIKK